MPTKRSRKRPYRAHEFGQALAECLGDLGDGGYVKVVMPDGLSAHRVAGLTPTLEEDILVRLEEAPCWRKRSAAQVEVVGPWQELKAPLVEGWFILLTNGRETAVGKWTIDTKWRDAYDQPLFWTGKEPTHYAVLPEAPK